MARKITIGLQVIPQHGDYEPMKNAPGSRPTSSASTGSTTGITSTRCRGDPDGKHFESLTIQAAMAAPTKRAEISAS